MMMRQKLKISAWKSIIPVKIISCLFLCCMSLAMSIRGQNENPTEKRPISGKDVIKVENIEVGEPAWGQNLLHLQVHNLTDQNQPFLVHIGGEYRETGQPRGFGMGMTEPVILKPRESRTVSHPYWIPPQLGRLDFSVKCMRPPDPETGREQDPFFRRSYSVTYQTPNRRCNELTPLPQFLKYDWAEPYRNGAKIPPFEVVTTHHFAFYVLPGSLAQREIDSIKKTHEQTLKSICDKLGVSFDQTISFFLFPDASSKRWCMNHQGDGLAFDLTIAEIYNETTRLDPAHELTHIVSSKIGNPPALFSEGLAVYMQKDHIWNGKPVDLRAAAMLRAGKLIPIRDLLRRTDIGPQPDDGEVAYPESASLVGYLVETYGWTKFLALYHDLKNGNETNDKIFNNILGVEITITEQGWLRWLNDNNK